MTHNFGTFRTFCLLVSVLSLASGCASGSRMLKEPVPVETSKSLAASANDHVEVTLDWVIVRNGPGSWAENVDWDEYVITVENLSDKVISVSTVQLTDALGSRVKQQLTRKALVKKSRETVKRYASSDLKVEAGASAGQLVASGGMAVAAGTALVATTVSGALAGALGGGAAVVGTAATVGVGAILAGPVIAVNGLVKASRHKTVSKEIQRRRTELSIDLEPGEAQMLTIFFPLAPSPQALTVTYKLNGETLHHSVDTSSALYGIHLAEP